MKKNHHIIIMNQIFSSTPVLIFQMSYRFKQYIMHIFDM